MKKRKGPQCIAEPQHIEGYAKVVNSKSLPPYSCHRHVLIAYHLSNAKICFQSSFMLITVQFFFLASPMSASVNVPTLDFGP